MASLDPVDGFPGNPSQQEFDSFRLPTHLDLLPPPTRLLDTRSQESRTRLEYNSTEQDAKNKQIIIHRRYKNALHPELDQGPLQDPGIAQADQDDETFLALSHCHDGLADARDRVNLDTDSLYRLAIREIAWVQRQLSAGQYLGRLEEGKWWIAPAPYILSLNSPEGGVEKSDPDVSITVENKAHDVDEDVRAVALDSQDVVDPWLRYTLGDRTNDGDAYRKAMFILHFVHIDGNTPHYALLVYRKNPPYAWFLDSIHHNRKHRAVGAMEIFANWLYRSGEPGPDHQHVKVVSEVPTQDDGWSCSMHAIANALAFVRFGVLGWDKIPVLNGAEKDGIPGGMLDLLLGSMHGVMRMETPAPSTLEPRKTRPRGRQRSKRSNEGAKTGAGGDPGGSNQQRNDGSGNDAGNEYKDQVSKAKAGRSKQAKQQGGGQKKTTRPRPPRDYGALKARTLAGGGGGPPPDEAETAPQIGSRRPSRHPAGSYQTRGTNRATESPGSIGEVLDSDDIEMKEAEEESINPPRVRRVRVRSQSPEHKEQRQRRDRDSDGAQLSAKRRKTSRGRRKGSGKRRGGTKK